MHLERETALREKLVRISAEIGKAETLMMDANTNRKLDQLRELVGLMRLQQTQIEAELSGDKTPVDPRD